MSTSIGVIGLRDANDPFHHAMVKVLEACRAAKITLPAEAVAYFGQSSTNLDPDEALSVKVPVEPYHNDYSDGFDVALEKVPAGVTKLRFTVSF